MAHNPLGAIYSNYYYPFGLVKEFTKEALEEQQRLFIIKCEKDDKSIEKYDLKGRNLKNITSKIFDRLENQFGGRTLQNKIQFLKSFILETKAVGIDSKIVADFMSETFVLEETNPNFYKKYVGSRASLGREIKILNKRYFEAGQVLLEEIYNYQSWKFGLNAIKRTTKEEYYESFDISKTYILEDGEKISDLAKKEEFSIPDYTMLWGDTNQGKTTYICRDLTSKRIILVPVIAALESIGLTHNASVLYEKENT